MTITPDNTNEKTNYNCIIHGSGMIQLYTPDINNINTVEKNNVLIRDITYLSSKLLRLCNNFVIHNNKYCMDLKKYLTISNKIITVKISNNDKVLIRNMVFNWIIYKKYTTMNWEDVLTAEFNVLQLFAPLAVGVYLNNQITNINFVKLHN